MERLSLPHRVTRLPIQQLVRYCVIGVVGNLTIYLLYLLVTYLGTAPRKAMTMSYLTGACLGFVANRKWTFSYRGSLAATMCRYAIAHLMGYLINFSMLTFFSNRLGFPHQFVQAAAIVIVAGFLFVTFKYFVFPSDKNYMRDLK